MRLWFHYEIFLKSQFWIPGTTCFREFNSLLLLYVCFLKYLCRCISTKVGSFLFHQAKFWFWYCLWFVQNLLHITFYIISNSWTFSFFQYFNSYFWLPFVPTSFLSIISVTSPTPDACITSWYESSYSSYPQIISDSFPCQLNLLHNRQNIKRHPWLCHNEGP